MWLGLHLLAKRDAMPLAHARLAALPDAEHGTFWGKPGEAEVSCADVGFANPPESGRPKVFIAKDRGASEVKDVPLSRVVAQQPTVVRSRVSAAIGRRHSSLPDIHAATDGHYYVEDGHHRVAAAMLHGQQTIAANVYGTQAPNPTPTPVPAASAPATPAAIAVPATASP